jgi:hypothetical protein
MPLPFSGLAGFPFFPGFPLAPPGGPNPFLPPPFLGPFPDYVLRPEVSGCAWYDYIKCGALIAGAGAACVVTESPRLCFEAIGLAIAAGCWDCLPGAVQDTACLLCRTSPLICPQGLKIRCGTGEVPCRCDDGGGEAGNGDRGEHREDCPCRARRERERCRPSGLPGGPPAWVPPMGWPGYGPWVWPGVGAPGWWTGGG